MTMGGQKEEIREWTGNAIGQRSEKIVKIQNETNKSLSISEYLHPRV